MTTPSTHPRPAPLRDGGATYYIRSPLAIGVGLATAGAALATLLAAPITTGDWRFEHAMLPVLVGVTIASCHLIGEAFRARKPLAVLGWLLGAALGTVLTMYVSIGSQKVAGGADRIAAHNGTVQAKSADLGREKRDLDVAKDMLRQVQRQHAEESRKGGCRANCQGLERSITVYKASVTGHEATIARIETELRLLGGERATSPRAAAFATAMAKLGADREHVRDLAETFDGFAFSAMWELLSIVAFGFGIGHRHARPDLPGNHPENPEGSAKVPAQRPEGPDNGPANRTDFPNGSAGAPDLTAIEAKVRAVARKVRTAAGQSGPQGAQKTVRKDRQQALADLLTMLAIGQAVPSQVTLAQRWRRPETTVSDWLKRWEAEGLIKARQAKGRVKVLA